MAAVNDVIKREVGLRARLGICFFLVFFWGGGRFDSEIILDPPW